MEVKEWHADSSVKCRDRRCESDVREAKAQCLGRLSVMILLSSCISISRLHLHFDHFDVLLMQMSPSRLVGLKEKFTDADCKVLRINVDERRE